MTRKISSEEKIAWALLASAEHGPRAAELRRARMWLDNNGLTGQDLWTQVGTLGRLVRWPAAKIQAVQAWARRWSVDGFGEYLAAHHWQVTYISEESYPPLLRFMPDFAPVLFYEGELTALRRLTLAVVGSRRASAYGEAVVTALLDQSLPSPTIVSGLMTGIDELAHRRAVALGWPTAAFLGYGLGLTWPRGLGSLREQIVAAGGVIVSEFAPDVQPRGRFFPIRNRLVAGASVATLVVEAAARSGSLITARLALDYGREVLVVPGSIFSPTSVGCLELVKKGALPVGSAPEVAAALAHSQVGAWVGPAALPPAEESMGSVESVPTPPTPPTLPAHADRWQDQVYQTIMEQALTSEELVSLLHADRAVVTALSWLELAGEIARGPDGRWRVVGPTDGKIAPGKLTD